MFQPCRTALVVTIGLFVQANIADSQPNDAVFLERSEITPYLTEISPNPGNGHPSWIEIYNPSQTLSFPLRELQIQTTRGTFRIENTDASISPQDYFVISFEKLEDGSFVAHRLEHPRVLAARKLIADGWYQNSGWIQIRALRSSTPAVFSPIASLAWGAAGVSPPPEIHGFDPSGPRGRVLLSETTGIYDPETPLAEGEVIALLPGGNPGHLSNWRVLTRDEATPAGSNRRPAPRFFTPPDGATVDLDEVNIAWLALPGDETYTIQIDTDENFSSPIPIPAWSATEGPFFRPARFDLPEGRYYYRVCRFDCESNRPIWSRTNSLILRDLDFINGTTKMVPGLEYAYQRKDTHMLCMRTRSAPTCDASHYDQGCFSDYWDKPHPPPVCEDCPEPWTCGQVGDEARATEDTLEWNVHGSGYCVEASISMISTAYGNACLSQDRISYQNRGWRRHTPDNSLGHDSVHDCLRADGTYGGDCREMLKWALGIDRMISDPQAMSVLTQAPFFTTTEPSFDEIEAAIEAGMPIFFIWSHGGNRHASVVDGVFRSTNGNHRIHVLDPLEGKPLWISAPVKQNEFVGRPYGWSQRSRMLTAWAMPPISLAAYVRTDEKTVWQDRDQDGLTDFDELRRFLTSPTETDSDGDCIPDRTEIESYRFSTGIARFCSAASCSAADCDGDGVRRENDCDDDGDKCPDGCELARGKNVFNPSDCSVNPCLVTPGFWFPLLFPCNCHLD